MKFKLRSDFTERIPLSIRRKGNTFYFQLQHEVVGPERYRQVPFLEYDKITTLNFADIGSMAIRLLNRFHEISDFTIHGLENMLANNDSTLLNQTNSDHLEFLEAKDLKDCSLSYDMCNIEYCISEKIYKFNIWWHKKGNVNLISCDSSQGEKEVLTFDEPLEFTDYPDSESLGRMIVEALDRSRQITDKAAGNPYPSKNIEMASGCKLTVSAPRDKHFIDEDDNGVCELYQLYGYYPREDSEEASAAFFIGMAAELNGEINEEAIRSAWEKQNGKAEFFEVKAAEPGIFKLRAEMRNKSIHRISYLLQIDESELFDCTMELRKPNSRKKLDEKLTGLFEEFARQCKFKN